MAVNCSEMRLNISWMAVVFPIKVAAIDNPWGGMSQTAVLTLLGIHSTKYLQCSIFSYEVYKIFPIFLTLSFYFALRAFAHPLPSWTFCLGKWQPLLSNGHALGHKRSSYSEN